MQGRLLRRFVSWWPVACKSTDVRTLVSGDNADISEGGKRVTITVIFDAHANHNLVYVFETCRYSLSHVIFVPITNSDSVNDQSTKPAIVIFVDHLHDRTIVTSTFGDLLVTFIGSLIHHLLFVVS